MSDIPTVTVPAAVWEQLTERLRLFDAFIYWRKRNPNKKDSDWELVCAVFDIKHIDIVQPPHNAQGWKSGDCKFFDSRDKAMRATEQYHKLPRCRVEGEP